MSFLFHSPRHILFPVTHTFDDRMNGVPSCPPKSTDMLRRCRVRGAGASSTGFTSTSIGIAMTFSSGPPDGGAGFLAPKTRCGGMISPSVRVSFAMRRRRVSVADGKAGVVGVAVGVGLPSVDGVPGVRGALSRLLPAEGDGDFGALGVLGVDGSVRARGAEVSRRTSGRGVSCERDLDLPNFMLGLRARTVSEDVRAGGGASETVELAEDGQAYMAVFVRVGCSEIEACRLAGLSNGCADEDDDDRGVDVLDDGSQGGSAMR